MADANPLDLLHQGIDAHALGDQQKIAGKVGDDDVLLVRDGEHVFAVGAKCTHYGAPLKDGRVVDGQILCPWHHACFRLQDGELLRAPALDSISSYEVEHKDDRLFVRRRRRVASATARGRHPASVTIVGAGASGFATLHGLRHAGYDGPITIFGSEKERPYDRIKLSKAYLGAAIDEDKLPLTSQALNDDAGTSWRLGTAAHSLDVTRRTLATQAGEHPFCALVLALGATPRLPDLAGSDLPHVFVLRSLDDARGLRAALQARKRRVVIVGSGFIGLEAAAQMTPKGHEVHVVAPQGPPMAAIVGQGLAQELERTHRSHGVQFHFGATVTRIGEHSVYLSDGSQLAADLVLLAMGVDPNIGLAKQAHLEVGDGIHVNAQLRTSARDIFAVGDCAAWPLRKGGPRVRIEHWAVAEQMGLVVADQLLGHDRRIEHVPFFWSEHYDIKLRYVGHCRRVQRAQIFGDLTARRAAIVLFEEGLVRAVMTLGRDDVALMAHEALAHGKEQTLPQLVGAQF